MVPRTIRAAYCIVAVVALLISLLGMRTADQGSAAGASNVLTAVGGPGALNNARLAASLADVAARSGATVARTVTDPSSPSTRRTVLVTTAPGSVGARWSAAGYPDFTRSMTTRVRPMSDLDRYDASASYEVVGTRDSARAFATALREASFEVTLTVLQPTVQQVVVAGFQDTQGLVLVLLLGCGSLCLVSSAGSPRRFALRRMAGRSRTTAVVSDLVATGTGLVTMAAAVLLCTLVLAWYNGLARWPDLLVSMLVVWVLLTLSVVIVHVGGAVMAARSSLAAVVRGRRPTRSLPVLTSLARVPVTVLVVAACFDVAGSLAVVRDGGAERDRAAAGDAVQLWVTAEPRPDVATQTYWDRFGGFARDQLASRDAFLSAVGDIGTAVSPVPVLFVDEGYLRHHPLIAADGVPVRVESTPVMWSPAGAPIDRGAVRQELRQWSFHGSDTAVHAGTLAAHTRVYTYPGDSDVVSWLDDPVVVVVPDAGAVFTDDQLGSWLSTGDVVFEREALAREAIRQAGLTSEVSAVVAVGQEAAERAHSAALDALVDETSLVAATAIAVALAALAAVVHRRRSGQLVFARFASGWSVWRADRVLILGEVAVVLVATVAAFREASERGVGRSGQHSATDPAVLSAAGAIPVAIAVAAGVGLLGMVALARTRRTAVRGHGKET